MATFPLVLTALLGKPLAYLIYLLIGFGFGYKCLIRTKNVCHIAESINSSVYFFFKKAIFK